MHNAIKESPSRKVFVTFNYIFLILTAVFCIFPLINVLAISLSSSTAASANLVKLWPVDFTLKSYVVVLKNQAFFKAFLISVVRVVIGIGVNMLLTVITAYPLSRPDENFKSRKYYSWFFMITILFSGGIVPQYMIVRNTGLIDTIWALVLPGALPVFNMIVMLNFFRGLPKELEEAAFIDGASYWKTLWSVYLPLSTPAIATLTLFCFVAHWNSWFDGLVYMNRPDNYPLQSYLQTVVVNIGQLTRQAMMDASTAKLVNNRTTLDAQIFLAMIPILVIYPFLQKYFTTGLVLGSVKE